MKIESTEFTATDVQGFLDEMLDHERTVLADRLGKASERLARLAPRVEAGHGGDAWSAHEVLAHITVLSKFYGVLVHKISSGQLTEVDLLSNVNLRDVVGAQMAEIAPSDLLQMALADHARTLKLLRATEARSLRQEAKLEDGRTISADQIARLPLINHLELHVDQLERALG